MAHFCEHTLFLQTDKRGHQVLKKDILEIAPNINAVTSINKTYLYFYRSNKMLERAIELASYMLLSRKIDNELFEKEKGVISEEYNMKQDMVKDDVYYSQDSIMYKNMLYTYEKSLGKPEEINELKIADIEKFKREFYTRNNFFICISTRFGSFKVKRLVKKYFLSKFQDESGTRNTHLIYQVPDREPSLQVVNRPNKKVNILISYNFDVGLKENQYFPELTLIKNYFNRTDGLLFSTLRENGLSYSATLNIERTLDNTLFRISITTSKEKILTIFCTLNQIYKDIYENGFDGDKIKLLYFNIVYTEDETIPHFHIDALRRRFNNYCLYGEKNLLSNKKYLKLVAKVDGVGMFNTFSNIVNKQSTPFITIMGDIDKNSLPSYNKLLEILHGNLTK